MSETQPNSDRQEGSSSQSSASSELRLSETERSSRNWSMFCHLAGLIGLGINIVTVSFFLPLGFVGPLIVWLAKRNEFPAVDEHGREATNFQITMAGLQFIFFLIPFIGWFLFLPALLIVNIALTIQAAVRASHGERFRYPFALRLLS